MVKTSCNCLISFFFFETISSYCMHVREYKTAGGLGCLTFQNMLSYHNTMVHTYSLSFSHTFSSFPLFSLSNLIPPSLSFMHPTFLPRTPSIPPTLSTPPPSLSLLSVVSFGDELSVSSVLVVAVCEKNEQVSVHYSILTTVYLSALRTIYCRHLYTCTTV